MKPPAMHGDWNEWSDEWRAERVPVSALASLVEASTRARRGIVVTRVLSFVATLLALAAVGAGLYHAANVLEGVIGAVVAFGICTAWIVDQANRRDDYGQAAEPPERYLMLRRALCVRRIRFARLIWTLAALDLAFLFPWWAGGMRYHGFGFRLVHFTSLWIPLALIVGFVIAAARIRAGAVDELRSLVQRDAS